MTEEEDLGRPEAVEFEWTRGGHVVSHVRSKEWIIDPVRVKENVFESMEWQYFLAGKRAALIESDLLLRTLLL